jgi:predicted esterase
MAIAGFSDGASYALSLGLTNGDLFTHVVAFSPGFVATDERRGKPPVFLSHGSADPVLPVGFTRDIARDLRDAGHGVTYQEFEGGHVLPYAVGERGFTWFAKGTPTQTKEGLAP